MSPSIQQSDTIGFCNDTLISTSVYNTDMSINHVPMDWKLIHRDYPLKEIIL